MPVSYGLCGICLCSRYLTSAINLLVVLQLTYTDNSCNTHIWHTEEGCIDEVPIYIYIFFLFFCSSFCSFYSKIFYEEI